MELLLNQCVPACHRRDHVLAAYVNAAASVRQRVGLARIEEFARMAGAPAHVVLRVLVAGGPFRPHVRFSDMPLPPGVAGDVDAAVSAYFRMPDAVGPRSCVNRRTDWRCAVLVDAAVNAAASHGPAGAMAELVDRGLPVDLVFRVLCQPGARRHYLAPFPVPAGQVHACRRRKHLHAAYVDAALRISNLSSVWRASEILQEQGLPQRVILRVLHLNGFRRGHAGMPVA